MSIMQKLHDSEINARISSFYDGSWTWEIGDEMNGFKAEGFAKSFEAAETALAASARGLYPDSYFATGVRPAGYIEQ